MGSPKPSDELKEITIRRARHDDYESVMDINRNVYNGFDYLAVNYHKSLHDKSNLAYVNEINGYVVSFLVFEVMDSGNIALSCSGRVQPSYQGRGLSSHKNTALFEKFKAECPTVKYHMYITTSGRHSERTINASQIINRWNFVCYKMAAERRSSLETCFESKLAVDGTTRLCSYAESLRLLKKNNDLQAFLSSYMRQFIPMGNDWSPKPLNEEGLREVMLATNVCVTLEDTAYLEETGVEFASMCETNDKNNNTKFDSRNNLKAFSYSTTQKSLQQDVVNIFLYTSDEKLLITHTKIHLSHAFKITDGCIGTIIHFPHDFDHSTVVQHFNELLGENPSDGWWPKEINCTEIVMGLKQK